MLSFLINYKICFLLGYVSSLVLMVSFLLLWGLFMKIHSLIVSYQNHWPNYFQN